MPDFFSRCTIVVGLLLGLLAGCQSESNSALPSVATAPPVRSTEVPASPLEQQVLARHDSLMEATGRLFALRRRLATLRPPLLADSARDPRRAAMLHRLDQTTRATVAADDAMMDWMHAYHRPAVGTRPDSAAAYFRRQLDALTLLGLMTRTAHDSATTVFRDLTTKPGAPRLPH